MTIKDQSQIRKELLLQRRIRPIEQVDQLSEQITDHLLELPFFKRLVKKSNLKVGFYHAMPEEVNLGPLLKKIMPEIDWRAYFPRIKDRSLRILEYAEMNSLNEGEEKDYQLGPYGIKEPHSSLPAIDPEHLDVIFVPGVAFGEQGERIGMGAGYYDRFLIQAPQALRISLAFDFQVLPKLPQKSSDLSVHWIVTEKREFRTPFVQQWFKCE